MDTSIFPLNYLKSIWSPKKAFKNRDTLNWLQIIIVFLFLTLLMAAPVYNHYQQIEIYSIRDFYPQAVELLDEDSADILMNAEISNGEMHFQTEENLKKTSNGFLAIGIPTEELPEIEEDSNFLVFGADFFMIGQEGRNRERIDYTEDFSLQHAASREDVIRILSELYTEQNRSSIVWSFTFSIYQFLFLVLFFIVFVYAYLLYLIRDFTLSDINTYKEAVILILNLLALPTVAALIYSFYRFQVILQAAIQIIGLILGLAVLYKQTKFQD